MARCTFCGNTLEKGTGKMYIKKDATIFYFCSTKCEKNMLKLQRVPRTVKWTRTYEEFKSHENIQKANAAKSDSAVEVKESKKSKKAKKDSKKEEDE
jgi:large subunit ribosomal protein L24e